MRTCLPAGPGTIQAYVRECLEAEEARNLVPRTLAEIKLYPGQFTRFCRTRKIIKPRAITPVLCKDFVHSFDHRRSPARTKTVVWIVRKFGAWLALRHFTPDNPAAALHHPRLWPRKKLPEYLTPTELRILLKTVIEKHSLQDLCIISLLAGTGLRSREIAQLRVKDINCPEHYLMAAVKGGWYKRTPLSAVIAQTLRHSFASHALRNMHHHVVVIKAILAHASLKTTENYLHP